MKEKKNAFTLIELLAIIVILAIIAVITVPIILNIIENSKKGAVIDSAYGYKDAIQKYYLLETVRNSNFEGPTATYNISDFPIDFKVSGEEPIDGCVQLEKGQVTAYSLQFGDYVVNFDKATNNVVAEKNTELSGICASNGSSISVNVGDELCFGPKGEQECFKVFNKYNENGKEMAMLFSNRALSYETNKQTTDLYPEWGFSSGAFWHDSTNGVLKDNYAKDVYGNSASYAGNPYPYVYGTGSALYSIVQNYLTILYGEEYGLPSTATGRLLSYEEATDETIFADANARKNGQSYWLGSAKDSGYVWSVYSNGNVIGGCVSCGSYPNALATRPVIIVPVADL